MDKKKNYDGPYHSSTCEEKLRLFSEVFRIAHFIRRCTRVFPSILTNETNGGNTNQSHKYPNHQNPNTTNATLTSLNPYHRHTLEDHHHRPPLSLSKLLHHKIDLARTAGITPRFSPPTTDKEQDIKPVMATLKMMVIKLFSLLVAFRRVEGAVEVRWVEGAVEPPIGGAEGGVGGNQQQLVLPQFDLHNYSYKCASYTGLEIEYLTIEEIKNIITPPNPPEAANYLAKEKELLIFQEESMPERFSIALRKYARLVFDVVGMPITAEFVQSVQADLVLKIRAHAWVWANMYKNEKMMGGDYIDKLVKNLFNKQVEKAREKVRQAKRRKVSQQ
ncbi:hypothetical protein OROMI_012048 [Orobanche minor]